MKRLPLFLISLTLFYAIGCKSKHHSRESDSLAQYRDTIIGKFNGNDTDTLIAEPIDTTIDRSLWNWRIYGKNNTVDTLILSHRFAVRLIQEGDLDGNGTDEFGIRREAEAGTWDNYCVYTYDKGEWKYLITRVRDKNFMIFNQAKDIEYWAAFQGRLIYLYSLVLLIPEDKLPV